MTALVTPNATTRRPDAAAAEVLRSCLRSLLAAESGLSDSWRLPASVSTDRFAMMAARHRVLPLLAHHLPQLDLPAELTRLIQGQGDATRLAALLDARELHRVLAVLRTAGVPVLVVKGLALAQAAYGEMAARGTGDLDLLVAPTDVAVAFEALCDGGWRSGAGPVPSDGPLWRYALRCGYERCFVGTSSVVDLHWRLDPTTGALPGFASLWERRGVVTIAGEAVATLGRWDALMHSCSHAAKDDWWWLRSLADVKVLAEDAELWRSPPTRPTPVQLTTLGLTFALLGAPSSTPAPLTETVAVRAARRRGRVQRQQAKVESRPDRGRLPGLGTLHAVRRYCRGSRAPADWLRVVLATVLPPHLLGGLGRQRWSRVAATLARRRLGRLSLWLRAPGPPR